MMQDKYTQLDELAAPHSYVVPPAADDLSYVLYFRQICKRYNINFAKAGPDERAFVVRMAEKGFCTKRA